MQLVHFIDSQVEVSLGLRELQKAYKPSVQQLQIAQMAKPTGPTHQSSIQCYLCGENHPLNKCPQLTKILSHNKGKLTLKRVLDSQLLLCQICESVDSTELPDAEEQESATDDPEYTTSNEDKDDSDFPEAG